MNDQTDKQLKKFKQAAKELNCDESEEALDKAFERLEPKTEPASEKQPKK